MKILVVLSRGPVCVCLFVCVSVLRMETMCAFVCFSSGPKSLFFPYSQLFMNSKYIYAAMHPVTIVLFHC